MLVAGVVLVAAVLGPLLASGRLDRVAPVVAVEGAPTQAVSGTATFALRVEDTKPGLGGWTARVGGRPAALTLVGDQATVDLRDLPEGRAVLVLEAWDRAWPLNTTRVEVPLNVDNAPPTLRLARRSLACTQGQAHPMFVQASEPLSSLTGTFREKDVTFFPLDEAGTVWRGLVGLPIEARTGTRTLALEATDAAGNVANLDAPIAIQMGRFSRGGTINLNPNQVKARKNEKAKERMRAERDTAYAWDQPTQLWEGPMLRPVEGGRLSSRFGRYRTYSDGKKSHHTGTDIASPTGTAVRAAAAGEVRFAGEQAIFGNVVIVHHGQSLSTSYNHLSRIDVEAGQRVEIGDVVGAVGTTGQSTGPHLHWGVVVGTVAVDGMRLLEDDLAPGPEPAWTHVTGDGRLIPLLPADSPPADATAQVADGAG